MLYEVITDVQRTTHNVARCAGYRGHNSQFIASQAIEQARLADVRLSSEDDMQPPLQQTPLACSVGYLVQLHAQALQSSKGVGCFQKIDLLIREIECCLYQRAQFDELVEYSPNFLREFPLQGTHGVV